VKNALSSVKVLPLSLLIFLQEQISRHSESCCSTGLMETALWNV
jgi:hypothetical protein